MNGLYRKTALVLAVLLLGASLPGMVSAEVRIGQKLPSITGRNLDGKTVDVDALYQDNMVILAFWSMFCKPCVAEISSLIDLQEKYRGQVTVVGINTDGELPPARLRAFIERYEKFEEKKINYEIIFDEGNRISRPMKVGFLPTVMAVDREGTVIDSFVGFEEKDAEEIFQGIEDLLPLGKHTFKPEEEVTNVFEVEMTVPVCGFYDESGWRESFYGEGDLDVEMEKTAEVAREMALKEAMNMALERLGVMLYQREKDLDCVKPYGVQLYEDPWNCRDSLTNLLNSLNFRKYTRVLESREEGFGNSYYVKRKVSVNMPELLDELEDLDLTMKPISVTFVVVNLDRVRRMKFEDAILSQSRYVGYTGFPAYTIYTTQEIFAEELEKMDFGGMKVFIEEAGHGIIEVEFWR
jgi:thiol-disulfide isomerase/thioredoxin